MDNGNENNSDSYQRLRPECYEIEDGACIAQGEEQARQNLGRENCNRCIPAILRPQLIGIGEGSRLQDN